MEKLSTCGTVLLEAITYTRQCGLIVGEILVDQVPSNPHDPHAVAVLKNTDIVGHVPRDISRIFSFFLLHGGVITCEEIGHRKFGKGLEVFQMTCHSRLQISFYQ